MRYLPQVTLRAPEKLSYVWAIMGNKEVIKACLRKLTENGDETGMPLEHKPDEAVV